MQLKGCGVFNELGSAVYQSQLDCATLLDGLKHLAGISVAAVYLVNINSVISSASPLGYGVPQGSLLSKMLLSL